MTDVTATGAIIDCDIHPTLRSPTDILNYMGKQARSFFEEYGLMRHIGFIGSPLYPQGHEGGLRRDADPDVGGRAGSDPAFMLTNHIQPNGIGVGVLNPIFPEQCSRNQDMSLAFCEATNDWLTDKWLAFDERYYGTIAVPMCNVEGAVREIHRCSQNRKMLQIGFPGRPGLLLGDRPYWPIYRAAVEADLPIAVHPQLGDVMVPVTSGGWPSYYIEQMADFSQTYQAHYTSLIVNGVFEEFPSLRFIFIEGGFGWLPALNWRLEKLWAKNAGELPYASKSPGHYARSNIWISSQPMEEYAKGEQLMDVLGWIGWDRFIFASDYPHWDNDDLRYIFPTDLGHDRMAKFRYKNASDCYKLR